MRLALAAAAGLVLAGVAALILGEHLESDVVGALPILAAVFVGYVEAELVSSVAARRDVGVRIAAGAIALVGMAWGIWIASGRGVEPLVITSWLAPPAAGVAGFFGVRRTPSSEGGSPTEP